MRLSSYYPPPPAVSLDQFHSPEFFVYVVNASLITSTTSHILARIDNDTSPIRNYEIRCDDGNYCLNGTRIPCPQGTYGNQRVRAFPPHASLYAGVCVFGWRGMRGASACGVYATE